MPEWVTAIVDAIQAIGLPSTLLTMIFCGGGYVAWRFLNMGLGMGEKHIKLVDTVTEFLAEGKTYISEGRAFIAEYRRDTLTGASCRYDGPVVERHDRDPPVRHDPPVRQRERGRR